VKKIIILLMAVSIILTSCGKSAGLSNGGKKAGNKTLLAGSDKKNLPQNTKGYWHTTTNFLWDYKIGVGITAGALILLGLAFYFKKDLAYWILNGDKKELEKTKERYNELDKDFRDKSKHYNDLTERHKTLIAKNKSLSEQIEALLVKVERLEQALVEAQKVRA
jgi:FtsZ-binding cell division protein ZapB